MISYFESTLSHLSIHNPGSKTGGEDPSWSEESLVIDDPVLESLLKEYFLQPFEKTQERYHFTHATGDKSLNVVQHIASGMMANEDRFHDLSIQLAKQLYESAAHPNIKPGELYVAYFKNLQIDGELADAIGIFKSESKEPYLKVRRKQKAFSLDYEEQAINLRKLDKGCLIFNTGADEVFTVAVIDQTNRHAEAAYWIDAFLQLKMRNDDYHQTNTTLQVYKNFVTRRIDEEYDVSKADKIDMLNRSMKYFKEKENFDLDEFSTEVIGDKKGIRLFKEYKQDYEKEFDLPAGDGFAINNAAVKKQARVFKSVLKLDRNFHIYIHGNRELIEQGIDEQGRKFYKIYFENES